MKLTQENDGLWYAVFNYRGVVLVGFAPEPKEAITYCLQLFKERDNAK